MTHNLEINIGSDGSMGTIGTGPPVHFFHFKHFSAKIMPNNRAPPPPPGLALNSENPGSDTDGLYVLDNNARERSTPM